MNLRWSQFFIPTLKENPGEAEIKSHRLMLRAGLIRKLASGTYNYLPLGMRALHKATAIVREEMDKAGALEMLLPALHPAEIWKETGRYDIMGEGIFRIKDRHGRENVLGPTHEEIITDFIRREIQSYRQMPVTFYQIQTKFRDEARPRSGIIRSREFIMKDAYSFHADDRSLDQTYREMREAYSKIFKRCGLEFYIVQADPGDMGGSGSQEFLLFSDAGEDRMVQFGDTDVVMSVEMASRKIKGLPVPGEGTPPKKYKKLPTPGHSSAESVVEFLKTKVKKLIKTMIYQNPKGEIFAVLVRGDHEVSDYKLKKFIPGAFLAPRDVIDQISAFGYSGPMGLRGDIPFYLDEDVVEMKDFVIGANERDHHFVGMNWEDIFSSPAEKDRVKIVGDFRQVAEGDLSPEGQPLRFKTAIELGHIFKLNLRYSEPMKALYADESGALKPIVMGCYGIGVNRILAAAIEQYADDKGIVWPKNIAPFQVLVTAVDAKEMTTKSIIEKLLNSQELADKNVDILVDDRDATAGIKFNDADLIGMPIRVTLGPKNLVNLKAEIKVRKTGLVELVGIDELIPAIIRHLDNLA